VQRTVVRLSRSSKIVTLDEARAHLRLDGDENDDYVDTLIDVAQEYITARIGRTLTSTRYRMLMDRFPRRTGPYRDDAVPYGGIAHAPDWGCATQITAIPIELPYPPATAVSLLTYARDGDGSTVILTANVDFVVDTAALPGLIRPPHGRSWPQDCRTYPGSVAVEWTAGYGSADAVPPQIRHAAKMLITHYFENRSAVADRAGSPVPEAVDALLSSVSPGHYAQIY
jgi:hypothetical protein